MPSYLVLARKYRPATFGDVVGQDHVVQTLKNSILSGRVAHAFLFCGVRGVGKTTVARVLAKALNCSGRPEGEAEPCNKCSSCLEIARGISVDVQEIDGASHTSVDNIREINENIKYPPVSSPYKIIIIDEVHMISINAFNALLKTLEEPPSHAKFIFATTESHKIPATINSRCQRFNFRTVSLGDITGGMADILEQEGIQASEEALSLVAREARGSFRDALSLLDQVIAFGAKRIAPQDVLDILGIAGRDSFGRLVKAILRRDAAEALGILHELFRHGYDPEQLVLDLIEYVRDLIVVKTVPGGARGEGMIEAPPSEMEEMERMALTTTVENLHNLFSILLRSESDVKRAGNPWVAAEMAVLKMNYAPDIVNLSEVLRKMKSQGPKSPTGDTSTVKPAPRSLPAVERRPAAAEVGKKWEDQPRFDEEEEDLPAEGFTITAVTPLPTGTPDEIWADLKDTIRRDAMDAVILSIMEHGDLIAFGPSEVEIGFTKSIYKEQFESRLQTKPELRRIFEELFGDAQVKILTLARETSLDAQDPYAALPDGQTDHDRALRNEAMEHPVTRAVLEEFEGSSVEEIRVLSSRG